MGTSIYKNIILHIEKKDMSTNAKIQSYGNKFIDFAFSTDLPELKEKLMETGKFVKGFGIARHSGSRWMYAPNKMDLKTALDMLHKVELVLQAMLYDLEKNNKPEWQIIAEANGWEKVR